MMSGLKHSKRLKLIVGGRKKRADNKEENHSMKCYRATKVTTAPSCCNTTIRSRASIADMSG